MLDKDYVYPFAAFVGICLFLMFGVSRCQELALETRKLESEQNIVCISNGGTITYHYDKLVCQQTR